jgi:hypothetical protein
MGNRRGIGKIAPAAISGLGRLSERVQEAEYYHPVINLPRPPLHKTFPVYLSNLFSLLPFINPSLFPPWLPPWYLRFLWLTFWRALTNLSSGEVLLVAELGTFL